MQTNEQLEKIAHCHQCPNLPFSPDRRASKRASFHDFMPGSKRGPMNRTPLFSILIFTSAIARAFASAPQMPYKISQSPKLSINNDLHFIGSGLKLQDLPIDEVLMILLEILKMEEFVSKNKGIL